MKALLVEDDEADIYLFNRFFQGHLDSVKTIKKAKEKLRCGSYEIVFLDLNLPDSFGFSSVQKIREIYSGGVVVLSGVPPRWIVTECLNLGADAVVEKGRIKDIERVVEALQTGEIDDFDSDEITFK